MREHGRTVVMVKFSGPGPQDARCALLRKWLGSDIAEAAPLFPGDDEEPELGSIFELTVKSVDNVSRIVRALSRKKEVEYAHSPAKRTPAR